MRTPAVLIAFAIAATSACGGAKSKPTPAGPEPVAAASEPAPAKPAEPPIVAAEAPDSVLVVAVVPKPGPATADVAAFLEALSPGSGAGFGLTAFGAMLGLPTSSEIQGLDLTQPVYALYVANDDLDAPIAVVAAVADEAALAQSLSPSAKLRLHDGYALFGPPEIVDDVANYALTNLRASSVLTDPMVIVRMPQVMSRYGAYVNQFMALMEAQMESEGSKTEATAGMMEALSQAVVDATELRLTARVDADRFELLLDVMLAPGSATAVAVSGQTPASYKWLSLLPSDTPAIVAAANLGESGGTWFAEWAASASREYMGTAAAVEHNQRLLATYRGEYMFGIDLAGGAMSYVSVAEVNDDKAAMLASRDMYGEMVRSKAGAARVRKLGTPKYRVRGVAVDEFATSLEATKLPPETAAAAAKLMPKDAVVSYATPKSTYVVVSAAKRRARRDMKALIGQVMSGTTGESAGIAALADESRAHGEFGFFAMDFVRILAVTSGLPLSPTAAPAYGVLGVRTGDNELRVRASMSVPALVFVAAMSGGGPVGLSTGSGRVIDSSELVGEFDALADRACACKDAACMQKVGEDMMAVLEGVDKDDEPSAEDQAKIMAAMDRIEKCGNALLGK